MDLAQLSDSANHLVSAVPVTQVLTIAVDKDSDEIETLLQPETRTEVRVGEPEEKLQEESVATLPDEQLTTILAGKSLATETFSTKSIDRTIPALAESHSAMAADNEQFVVKASELVEHVRKFVAGLTGAGTCIVFYKDIQMDDSLAIGTHGGSLDGTVTLNAQNKDVSENGETTKGMDIVVIHVAENNNTGSNFIGSVNFIPVFVFLYLPKQAGGKCLVTLKGSTVRFNDTGKIGYFYCKFIFEKKSKILRNDLRHRRDNFFKMLEPFEKNQSLEKVRKGEEYYKDYKGRRYVKGFVKYKVTSSVLLDLFRRSYSVEGHSSMAHCASHGETSSDSGIGMTQSDEADESLQECHGSLSSEPSSETGKVSEFAGSFVNETNPSKMESQASQQPAQVSTAAEKRIAWIIIPDKSSNKGGGTFTIWGKGAKLNGSFYVVFGDNATYKVSTSGGEFLHGPETIIPRAKVEGSHSVNVLVYTEAWKLLGAVHFKYDDCKDLRSSQGSDPRSERRRQTKESSDSDGYPGSYKKAKNVT